MFIKTTYIGTLDGVHGMWCGFKPEGLIVEEERMVLYPEEGYLLENKFTHETETAVWIKQETEQDNWQEILAPEETEE